jgi:hypothetical protein
LCGESGVPCWYNTSLGRYVMLFPFDIMEILPRSI